MYSPADIVRQLLVDLGLTEESGSSWPAYVSFLPELPHEAICVYDTAGNPDGRLMEDGTRIEHPGIQIRVRGRTYLDAWQKANSIALALDIMGQILIALYGMSTYLIHNVSRTGTVISAGVDDRDDRRRYHFTINAVMTIPNNEDFAVFLTEDGGNFLVTQEEEFLTTE